MVQAWIKRRAAADGPMQQAAAARTAEPPPVVGKGDTDDVVSVIGWAHNQVKYLQEQLETIPGVREGGRVEQQRQRASIVDMMRIRLSEHEAAEEQVLWPAIRKALPRGDEYADTALKQEAEGKDLLEQLDGLGGTEDDFDELVEKLVKALRRHVAFEDRVLLELSESMSEDDRAKLGRKVRHVQSRATTRQHPNAPDTPPLNRVAGGLAAVADRTRDAVTHRPADDKGQIEPQPEASQ
jgi:hemerythrin-like domain-containing protein